MVHSDQLVHDFETPSQNSKYINNSHVPHGKPHDGTISSLFAAVCPFTTAAGKLTWAAELRLERATGGQHGGRSLDVVRVVPGALSQFSLEFSLETLSFPRIQLPITTALRGPNNALKH